MFKQLRINITLAHALILIPKYQKMLKAVLSNKEKLLELENTPLNEICSAIILKKLPEKFGDPRKFLIPCGFTELKCKALLANLGASINLIPLSVWKKLGRPFLRTTRALIDIHGEEIILCDGDERLTLNMRHDTSSYSNQPEKESINLINVLNDSNEDLLEDLFLTNHQSGNPTFSFHLKLTSPEVKDNIFDPEGGNVLPEKLLDLDSTKDFHPPHHVNPLSGSTTSSSSPTYLLEEFTDELALIIFPSEYDDDLQFDIGYDLKEIEYLVHHDPIKDKDSILKDSIDQSNLVDLNDNLVDSMPEMFTDEHALDYSSPPLYDEYDDDLFKVESDTKNVDTLPSTNKEDKVFNPGILIQENLFEVITHVAPEKNEKKLTISNASLMIEDFDPPLYELPFFKKVPRSKILLLFSSENEEKVLKPGIHTSGKVHFLKLSHQGYKVFKINQILKSLMKIFPFFCGENIHILDVPCLHLYPLDKFKYGGWVKLSDPKQALRGRHLMLILSF
nr:reverse transcriptase domain-containing protein [Tanacetum cinerariifolium]